jgi:transcriptional regulator with XRE-family HTH domain
MVIIAGFVDLAKMDQDQIIKAFGDNLRAARRGKKLSQERLAVIANLDTSNISEIEGGKINPTLTTIVALAKALEIDSSELIPK